MKFLNKAAIALALSLAGCAAHEAGRQSAGYDVVIRGGTIYDGSGGAAYVGDVGIRGDRIAYVGPWLNARGAQ